MSVVVTGASDDLIEVDGDISEEFYARGEDADLLAFSDGTVLRITYSKTGVWRISLVTRGTAELTITQAPEGDDENYSDRAVLDGDIRWVVNGAGMATR